MRRRLLHAGSYAWLSPFLPRKTPSPYIMSVEGNNKSGIVLYVQDKGMIAEALNETSSVRNCELTGEDDNASKAWCYQPDSF
jgi:hypothetical protein